MLSFPISSLATWDIGLDQDRILVETLCKFRKIIYVYITEVNL